MSARRPSKAATASRGSATLRRVLVAMLLGVVVYGGFAVWRGLGKIGGELARFQWWAFAAACGLAFGNYLIRWLKWEFYLARLGIRGIPQARQPAHVPQRLRPHGHAGQGRRGLQVDRPLRDARRPGRAHGAHRRRRARDRRHRRRRPHRRSARSASRAACSGRASARRPSSSLLVVVANRRPLATPSSASSRGCRAPSSGSARSSTRPTTAWRPCVQPANLHRADAPLDRRVGARVRRRSGSSCAASGRRRRSASRRSSTRRARSRARSCPVPGGLGVTETSLQEQMQELGHVAPTHEHRRDDPRPLRDALVRGPRRLRGALAAQAPPPVPARRRRGERRKRAPPSSSRQRSAVERLARSPPAAAPRSAACAPVMGWTKPSTRAWSAWCPRRSATPRSTGRAAACRRAGRRGPACRSRRGARGSGACAPSRACTRRGSRRAGAPRTRTCVTARLPVRTRDVNRSRSRGWRPWSVENVRVAARADDDGLVRALDGVRLELRLQRLARARGCARRP